MTKNVLVISSTLRKNGNSEVLAKEFLKGAVLGAGVGNVGDIQNNPAVKEAYEIGARV